VCALDSSHRETRTGAALGHDWNEWGTPAAATVTEDGFKTRTCKRDNSHTETAFSGEYATGTEGLEFEAIGSPATAYRVGKGTVTIGAVYIPAMHRPDADSPYLPVTKIGLEAGMQSAFQFTTNITSITIPASVTSIDDYAFQRCNGLTSIMVDAGNPNYSSEGGILYNKAKTILINVPIAVSGTVTIPASVTTIGQNAFADSRLTSVTIPASVTSIGSQAFVESSFISIIFAAGSQLKTIGYMAFYGCSGLTSVTIPASVTSISQWAFNNCSGLTSVTFAGTIASGSFNTSSPFPGDLRTKFYADNSANGTPGTYTRPNGTSTWTRQ
jgi:hypothetical protein